MDQAAVIASIQQAYDDVAVETIDGGSFLFAGADRMLPFVTVVWSDAFDSASDLSRPGVFRLNIGVSKATFTGLVGSDDAGHDYTALDTVMPHPVYAAQSWVCVLNPSDATFESLRPLLAEAHQRAAERDARIAARTETAGSD